MHFSFNNPLLALSLAGFAIIFSTAAANPVITHKPIPVRVSPTTSSFLPPTLLPTTIGETSVVNATSSTTLIPTTRTTLNPGIPLYPSTIQDQSPTTTPQPNNGGGAGCGSRPTDINDRRKRCIAAW